MIRGLVVCLSLMVTGCASTTPQADTTTRAGNTDSTLPPIKSFITAQPSPPAQSNSNTAADFLSLHFELESGRPLPVFTRFETPITVRVTGQPPVSLMPDLKRLIARLQTEAGVDIRLVSGDANITIQAVSRDAIRRALPDAACFVAPNVTTIAEFRRNRRNIKTSWSALKQRQTLGIFVPNDASPQEVRDCLHEELAQAIGPLNDLYRLPDSVFNDDNVHTVLTGFDMLILRATYAPELRSGMSRSTVAARLPGILSRLNPRGDNLPPHAISPTPRNWIATVQAALGHGADIDERRSSANQAIQIAQQQGWRDHRLAFSHYMMGRMTQVYDPTLAQQHYSIALTNLRRTPGTELHRAYITTQTAAYAIATGDGATALRLIKPNMEIATQSENAALLATLMLLQAEALDLVGQSEKARAVRLDSLGWARYGFGSEWAVREKMQEIAAISPYSQHKSEQGGPNS